MIVPDPAAGDAKLVNGKRRYTTIVRHLFVREPQRQQLLYLRGYVAGVAQLADPKNPRAARCETRVELQGIF